MLNPFSTIAEIKDLIENKTVTKEEVVKFFQEFAKQENPKFNAAIEVFDNPVFPDKNTEGRLAGIPCFFKDNICLKGKHASAGSKILKDYDPCYFATVAKSVLLDGGVILGRANMDEFAMGSTGEFSAYGATKNPWDVTRSPGGSSSGSAAAVAAGLAPWAIGTETGGSVRQPAAFCGLVGMYPTYGLLSRFGIIPFGSSLDQAGPITRSVYDCALVMSTLAGHDPNDSTCLPEPKKDFTKKLSGKLPSDLKIGVIRDSIESEGVNPEIKQKFQEAVKELENMGAKITYVDIPDLKHGISTYFIVSRAEAASNLSRIDGSLFGMRANDPKSLEDMYWRTRTNGFGKEVKRRIIMGNYVLSSKHRSLYEKANHVRAMIRAELENALADVDLLVSPTTSSLPFELGKEIQDPLEIYMNDYFTVPNCVAGFPAISVPCGLSKSNLPIGFQFIGPRLSEEKLLQTAHAYEEKVGRLHRKA